MLKSAVVGGFFLILFGMPSTLNAEASRFDLIFKVEYRDVDLSEASIIEERIKGQNESAYEVVTCFDVRSCLGR